MRTLLVTLLLILCSTSFAQQGSYSKVRILTGKEGARIMGELGIPAEGIIQKGQSVTGDFSEDQIRQMREAGLPVEVLIPDVKKFYQERNTEGNPQKSRSNCTGTVPNYNIPSHFTHGSMGGYLTLTEMLAQLDQMRALYPTLISAKQPISTYTTVGGRSLYWVRLSSTPDVNSGNPEALYLALTHAREPMGMQQLIFFMWYLLENYNTNTEIQYLLQNTQLYFIPCVNPDGYAYNESTDPGGGGMWRKNRRNNGSGEYGVDLNRNYGFQWGIDNVGSSPDPADDTYRGPSAFSEPETQAVKWFCEQHDIQVCIDNHCYGGYMLYPWGYQDQLTPDSSTFRTYANYLTEENGYPQGNVFDLLGYMANGGSMDWYYGEQGTKNKILGFSPESGDGADGFWPAETRINDICKGFVACDMYIARFVAKYAVATDKSPTFLSNQNGYVKYDIQRLGMGSPATYTVNLQAYSANIVSTGSGNAYSSLGLLQSQTDSISYTLSPSIQSGDEIVFLLTVNNGITTRVDTLKKRYGTPQIIYSTACSNTTGWTGTWATTTTSYVSAPSSITDSPSGTYNSNANTTFTLTNAISLTNAVIAEASFWAKWDIESDYDYVEFQISTNGGSTWIPLCGKYTQDGSGIDLQPLGDPLYEGTQSTWVLESVDLTDYIGSSVKFRFKLESDNWTEGDGFYFDDFKVQTLLPAGVAEAGNTTEISIYPNPATDEIFVSGGGQFVMYDINGREVAASKLRGTLTKISVHHLESGLYLCRATDESGNVYHSRIVVE